MANNYEYVDELIGLLEKAMKTKPKDVKQRTELHKKANEKVKVLRESIKESQGSFTGMLDDTKEALYAALGAAADVRFRDREVAKSLKQATKCNEAISRPKGWEDSFDKAFKIIADWDPKAEDADVLEKAIKLLNAATKSIDTWYATYRKEQAVCNTAVNQVSEELKSMKDQEDKALIQPYIDKYRAVLAKN